VDRSLLLTKKDANFPVYNSQQLFLTIPGVPFCIAVCAVKVVELWKIPFK
jgi:hypothetical protein